MVLAAQGLNDKCLASILRGIRTIEAMTHKLVLNWGISYLGIAFSEIREEFFFLCTDISSFKQTKQN